MKLDSQGVQISIGRTYTSTFIIENLSFFNAASFQLPNPGKPLPTMLS